MVFCALEYISDVYNDQYSNVPFLSIALTSPNTLLISDECMVTCLLGREKQKQPPVQNGSMRRLDTKNWDR